MAPPEPPGYQLLVAALVRDIKEVAAFAQLNFVAIAVAAG
jgi:hypothetical protein